MQLKYALADYKKEIDAFTTMVAASPSEPRPCPL
jgi:hypothetical protein